MDAENVGEPLEQAERRVTSRRVPSAALEIRKMNLRDSDLLRKFLLRQASRQSQSLEIHPKLLWWHYNLPDYNLSTGELGLSWARSWLGRVQIT